MDLPSWYTNVSTLPSAPDDFVGLNYRFEGRQGDSFRENIKTLQSTAEFRALEYALNKGGIKTVIINGSGFGNAWLPDNKSPAIYNRRLNHETAMITVSPTRTVQLDDGRMVSREELIFHEMAHDLRGENEKRLSGQHVVRLTN